MTNPTTCPVCRSPVKVMGDSSSVDNTLHYEPAWKELVEEEKLKKIMVRVYHSRDREHPSNWDDHVKAIKAYLDSL